MQYVIPPIKNQKIDHNRIFPKKYGSQFLWGTDNKVYQITVPNWHYPPCRSLGYSALVEYTVSPNITRLHLSIKVECNSALVHTWRKKNFLHKQGLIQNYFTQKVYKFWKSELATKQRKTYLTTSMSKKKTTTHL